MDGVVKQLKEQFPTISWSTHEATEEVQNDFGKGTILRGFRAGKLKEFFILDKDKQKLRWGIVIAHELGDDNVQFDGDA